MNWLDHVSRLEYLKIREKTLKSDARSQYHELQTYLAVRARLILGFKDEAAKIYRGLSLKPALQELLDLGFSIFTGQPIEDHVSRLTLLTFDSSREGSYYQAEAFFLAGYSLNLLDQYQRALPYHELAHKHYELAELPGPKGVALFNLAVAQNNLGLWSGFEDTLKKLHDLSAHCPSLDFPSRRLSLYRSLDCEEWEKAEEYARTCLNQSQSLARQNDLGELCVALAYILLKKGQNFCIRSDLRDLSQVLSRQQRDLLAYFENVDKLGLPSFLDFKKLLREFEKMKVPSYTRLFLMDILIERIENAGDPEQVLLATKLAKAYSLAVQQNLCLIDFRLREARAHMALGNGKRAQKLAQTYRAAALKLGSTVRLKKVDEWLPKVFEPNFLSRPGGKVICLYLKSSSVAIDGQLFDLLHNPTLFDLLLVLAEHPEGLLIHEIFYFLYGTEYKVVLHKERLNSVIARARRYFRGHQLILRSGGRVSLHPSWKVRMDRRGVGKPMRQNRLLELIKKSPTGLQIGDLSSHFDRSARTLQSDLTELGHKNLIHSRGQSRATRYFHSKEIP